jgi:hypothetical protein
LPTRRETKSVETTPSIATQGASFVTWRSIEPQSAEAADGFVVWSALAAAIWASMRRSQNRALFSFVFGLGV